MIPDEELPADRFHILLMGHLDGELTDEEEREFRVILERDPKAGEELARYREISDLAQAARLKEPQDYEWDRFWRDLYNRMERGTGWTLLLIGTFVFSAALFGWLWSSPSLPLWVKVGVTATSLGVLVLFLSVLRGQLRARRFDRYREVKR